MSVSRTFARSSAVQALYQMQVGGQGPLEIERQFVQEHGLGRADPEYFKELLHGVVANLASIDQAIAEFTSRPLDELDPVERAVLRLGTFELLFRQETPYRVVINECINLAKRFGATDGHKYVNGILDKVARKRRAVEVGAAGR
ncbi:transcription antitermination factor NusB [Methylogaea oryzae]|uniref:Transcription antitermination protein NusB n=1 Tax=Methylogaea oryzae TaxID=1295382 RepID=A0A8D4VM42_9GAMM|nr:transcription antitermination factor NusB [Methylogaea oryzae]BBL70673.1 N utilization substance protein B [Methylogaea oryzae]